MSEDNEENSVDSADLPAPDGLFMSDRALHFLSQTKEEKKRKRAHLNRPDKDVKVTKNFQGYDLEKCVPVAEYRKWIYVPPQYGALSRAKYSPCVPNPPHGMWHCNQCHLLPCISMEYLDEVKKALPEDPMETEEPELVLMLCRAYRKAVLDHCGKTFMENIMPNDNQLPQCAVEFCVRTARRKRGNMLAYDDDSDDGRRHFYTAKDQEHRDYINNYKW